MNTNKYYVRITTEDEGRFDEYLQRNGINGYLLSRHLDSTGCSSLYYLTLTDHQVSSIKLSFDLIGCVHLERTEATVAQHK